ncbi:hypothetical protein ACJX0J_036694 [Zea mays]
MCYIAGVLFGNGCILCFRVMLCANKSLDSLVLVHSYFIKKLENYEIVASNRHKIYLGDPTFVGIFQVTTFLLGRTTMCHASLKSPSINTPTWFLDLILNML